MRRTLKEKQAIVDKVNELRANGMTVNEAAVGADIDNSTYYNYKYDLKGTRRDQKPIKKSSVIVHQAITPKKTYKVKTTTPPVSAQMAVVIGNLAQLLEVLKGLNQ